MFITAIGCPAAVRAGVDAGHEPDQRPALVHLVAVGQLLGVGDLDVQRVRGTNGSPLLAL